MHQLIGADLIGPDSIARRSEPTMTMDQRWELIQFLKLAEGDEETESYLKTEWIAAHITN